MSAEWQARNGDTQTTARGVCLPIPYSQRRRTDVTKFDPVQLLSMMPSLSSKKTRIFLFLVIGFVFAIYLTQSPSNNRDWAKDQVLLSYANLDGDSVAIKNIRDFTYLSESEYEPHYYDKLFDTDDLASVDYIVEPFGSMGAAHTFLSFGFANGDYVAISVEIRKEVGESFSPVKGLFRAYELMYVIADERDVIKLRANYRKHIVYLYPVDIPREKMKELFLNMLTRANSLKESPEFYNTLTNTCTTNIAKHVNAVAPDSIPWDLRLFLPKNSDELAYELGLIDRSITLEEARARHMINARAEKYANDPDFSIQIRRTD